MTKSLCCIDEGIFLLCITLHPATLNFIYRFITHLLCFTHPQLFTCTINFRIMKSKEVHVHASSVTSLLSALPRSFMDILISHSIFHSSSVLYCETTFNSGHCQVITFNNKVLIIFFILSHNDFMLYPNVIICTSIFLSSQ